MWIQNIHAQIPIQFLQMPTKKKKDILNTLECFHRGKGMRLEDEGKRQWSESTSEQVRPKRPVVIAPIMLICHD